MTLEIRLAQKSTLRRGIIAEAEVIADLTRRGYDILLPVSGHLPYDLAVENRFGTIRKLQVKYKCAKQGRIDVPLTTIHTNSSGAQRKPIDRRRIDAYAIYCPDTGKIYYVPMRDMAANQTGIRLRVAPLERKKVRRLLSNGKKGWVHYGCTTTGMRPADDFLDPDRLFRKAWPGTILAQSDAGETERAQQTAEPGPTREVPPKASALPG